MACDKKKGKASDLDVHIGMQLRQRRALRGYSQERLAGEVGVTFQQIQKYENGGNRISASTLYRFSKILKCPVNYFFEDWEEEDAANPSQIFRELPPRGIKLVQKILSIAVVQDQDMAIKGCHVIVDAYTGKSKNVRKS
ncbi:MAG: hypothetical protein DI626_10610 [Micavibrio aeruginosavorus]|uniref:HTH cro/C1-type domain-containing protein n=1 Tax=Micavibrio aeruginosavorus TaxID=349221 RepID=A0A2W5BF72_9BACT|nr:MAG: hypothetical protein DI626_10610 [Micavibrio aeruginosavorus]